MSKILQDDQIWCCHQSSSIILEHSSSSNNFNKQECLLHSRLRINLGASVTNQSPAVESKAPCDQFVTSSVLQQLAEEINSKFPCQVLPTRQRWRRLVWSKQRERAKMTPTTNPTTIGQVCSSNNSSYSNKKNETQHHPLIRKQNLETWREYKPLTKRKEARGGDIPCHGRHYCSLFFSFVNSTRHIASCHVVRPWKLWYLIVRANHEKLQEDQ